MSEGEEVTWKLPRIINMLVLFHMHEIRSSRDSLSALTSYLRGKAQCIASSYHKHITRDNAFYRIELLHRVNSHETLLSS